MSAEMHDYVIALQRAIDAHCRGELIAEDVAKECPYHAGKLNRNSAERDRLEAVNAELAEALEKIIEMNVHYCICRYGDASQAESMACVVTARAALNRHKGEIHD